MSLWLGSYPQIFTFDFHPMIGDELMDLFVEPLRGGNDIFFGCRDEAAHLLNELFESFRFLVQIEDDLPEPACRCDVPSVQEKDYSGCIFCEHSPLDNTPTLSFVSMAVRMTATDSVITVNDFRIAPREPLFSFLATASSSFLNHSSRS